MTERIRFLGDANFNHLIVRGLIRQQPLIDFENGESAQLRGLSDPDVLALAATKGRVLVSHDYRTMPTHFAQYITSGHHTPGVLLIHQTRPVAQGIEALLLVWEASDPDEWRDKLTYLL